MERTGEGGEEPAWAPEAPFPCLGAEPLFWSREKVRGDRGGEGGAGEAEGICAVGVGGGPGFPFLWGPGLLTEFQHTEAR